MLRAIIFILALVTLLLGPMLISRPTSADLVFAQESPTVTPTEQDKLKKFNVLIGEHVFLTGQMMIARYENRADFDEALEAVGDNTKEIAGIIGDFYPSPTEDEFITIWNRHINSYILYADSKKENDRNKESQAINNLQIFTRDCANLLSRGNNGLFATTQNYLSQHVLFSKKLLDSYIEEDFTAMYKTMHESYTHGAMMTDNIR